MIQYIFGAIHEDPFCFERVLCYNVVWNMERCHVAMQ